MGLTITRRRGEKVILETTQGPIEIQIMDIKGNSVKVKFECSRDISILRSEIIGRKKSTPPDVENLPKENGTETNDQNN